MRIVVIGGVAAGMSAASQAKRRRPDVEVVALEKGPYVSYGACGMPYNIEDPDRSMEDLVVITPERFRTEREIDVRTGHEALRIDAARKLVRVRDLGSSEEYDLAYDRLVIATGASAVRLPLPGAELDGVFVLRELTDGGAIKQAIAERQPRHVAIVGGGYIGLEMCDVLLRRGIVVTILERLDQLAPGIDSTLAGQIRAEVERHGAQVRTGASVEGFERRGGGLLVRTDGEAVEADLVLVAVGARPNVRLAKDAGVDVGPTGAIAVDDSMRTNLPDVFAAGDCVEALHLVSGEPVWVPLGPTANKQGKVAGANAIGADERFRGIVGTAAFQVLDLQVGRTGLSLEEAERLGLDAFRSESRHRTRGHSFPGSGPVTTVLTVERGTGRLLGAQQVGPEGVQGRINVYATALTAGMAAGDLSHLDLAYAPPLAPVYDPLLISGTVAEKELERSLHPAQP
jgi:NADPH-dependent 2,4-dienoyl-CoA reductase/sulfur reductase-like enzyme